MRFSLRTICSLCAVRACVQDASHPSCPSCGRKCLPHAKFCPGCGFAMQPRDGAPDRRGSVAGAVSAVESPPPAAPHPAAHEHAPVPVPAPAPAPAAAVEQPAVPFVPYPTASASAGMAPVAAYLPYPVTPQGGHGGADGGGASPYLPSEYPAAASPYLPSAYASPPPPQQPAAATTPGDGSGTPSAATAAVTTGHALSPPPPPSASVAVAAAVVEDAVAVAEPKAVPEAGVPGTSPVSDGSAAAASDITCVSCSASMRAGAKFCRKCGTPVQQ